MIHFGPFRMDAERQTLWRYGQLVPIGPKVVKTLAILVSNKDQVVLKDELIRQVWGETVVEENSLAHNISILRKFLKTDSTGAYIIETVPRRGYRFREILPESTLAARLPISTSPGCVLENAGASLPDAARDIPLKNQIPRTPKTFCRRRLAWGIAGIALVVGIASGLWTGIRYRSTEAADETPAFETPVTSLAILPYRNRSGDPSQDWMALAVPEALHFDLNGAKHLRLVPADRLQQVLRDLQVTPKSSPDDTALQNIAQLSHADSLVFGQYQKVGQEIRIDSTVLDFSPYRRLEIRTLVNGEKDMDAAVDSLSGEMRSEVGLSPSALQEAEKHALHFPVLAVRAFDDGERLAAAGSDAQAVHEFQVAINQKPDFALAYSNLAEAYASRGEYEKADQASHKAVELSANLSPQDRYLIKATDARIKDEVAGISAYRQPATTGFRLRLIDYVLWIAAPILQVLILVSMFRRGLSRELSSFFTYNVVQVLAVVVLYFYLSAVVQGLFLFVLCKYRIVGSSLPLGFVPGRLALASA